MANAEQGTAITPLQRGWTALANGRWESARAVFAEAVATQRTAEALEGLSWAAWWLDDAATVFEARERAFQLYRRRGELASAARMAIWLAVDELDFRGAVAVGSGWLRRAQRLLEPLEPVAEHGWLAFNEGYFAFARGETVRAAELAETATELGRRFAVPDLEMLGLALRGSVLVESVEVEEGMACLDEATVLALAGEARIPISAAWACCFLVTACEAVRDYPRAFAWCDRIAEFAQRYGSRYMLGFCRAHYGVVHLWRGQWEAAEAELAGAAETYARSRPAMAGEALAALAELRRRQGRWEEAERLLEEAGENSAMLCRAALALDRGDAEQASRVAERVLRQLPDHRKLARAPALELLICARAAADNLAGTDALLEELRETARRVGTTPLQASADFAAGLLAAARLDHEGARRLFEDAVDRFAQSGAAYDAARARLELGTTLRALGHAEAARREVQAALAILTELGAAAAARRARSVLGAIPAQHQDTPATVLTRREREVLGCVAQGLTNKQIGERLVISEHTVHRHISNILRKLDLPSRTAAAAHAARSGLLPTSGE